MADVKELVRTKIAGKKVMVFSKTYCPYCKKAKEVLRRHLGKEISNKDMEIWELDNEERGHQIQQELKRLTGATSVPRVFINGKFVGGGSDVEELEKNRKLGELLKA